MNKTLALMVLVLIFANSCAKVEIEESELKYEDSTVAEVSRIDCYLAPGSSFECGPRPTQFGEKYKVIFACSHGRFEINQESVYQKFNGKEGLRVKIAYRDVKIYKVGKDGKKIRLIQQQISHDLNVIR